MNEYTKQELEEAKTALASTLLSMFSASSSMRAAVIASFDICG